MVELNLSMDSTLTTHYHTQTKVIRFEIFKLIYDYNEKVK